MPRCVAVFAAFFLALLAEIAGSSSAFAQDDCAPIKFPAGKNAVTLAGTAAPEGFVCYRLDAEIGQKFTLKILRGGNTIFSVTDVQDAVDRFSFTARKPSYEIRVGQLMRSAAPEKYRLSIKRSKAGKKSAGTSVPVSTPAGDATSGGAASAAGGAGQPFRDCEHCPEMVPVPPGTFMMGVSPKEAKQLKYVQGAEPQHKVTIGYPFAIGRFEVTVEEFDAYVNETGAKVGGKCGIRVMESGPRAFKYSGTLVPGGDKTESAPYAIYIGDGSYAQPGLPITGRQPAVCVSRNEIKGYLAWLSEKSGKHYRLPTEAEWEYAYRAGTSTMNFWGNDFSKTCEYANFADRKSGYQAAPAASCAEKIHPDWTAEVGSYKPNPWGLYDMPGNAQETVEDCLHENYVGAPADGSPWTKPDCVVFVARGGDYELTQFSMRASERLLFGYVENADDGMWTRQEGSDERFNIMGFRVAVSLDGTSWDKEVK
jgi:formylglycine-generating enzyme required for sulfatase activity